MFSLPDLSRYHDMSSYIDQYRIGHETVLLLPGRGEAQSRNVAGSP